MLLAANPDLDRGKAGEERAAIEEPKMKKKNNNNKSGEPTSKKWCHTKGSPLIKVNKILLSLLGHFRALLGFLAGKF